MSFKYSRNSTQCPLKKPFMSKVWSDWDQAIKLHDWYEVLVSTRSWLIINGRRDSASKCGKLGRKIMRWRKMTPFWCSKNSHRSSGYQRRGTCLSVILLHASAREKNEERERENVWRVASVGTEEGHLAWQGQKQTKRAGNGEPRAINTVFSRNWHRTVNQLYSNKKCLRKQK